MASLLLPEPGPPATVAQQVLQLLGAQVKVDCGALQPGGPPLLELAACAMGPAATRGANSRGLGQCACRWTCGSRYSSERRGVDQCAAQQERRSGDQVGRGKMRSGLARRRRAIRWS